MTRFELNGRSVEIDVADETPLLWVLRDDLGMTGTKFGCGVAQCGACTIHMDGVATRSCVLPIGAVAGTKITTIEGLAAPALSFSGRHPLQRLWVDYQVPQCGYCQSGMIMAAAALLAENPAPSEDDIDAAMTNICRCGTYPRIKAAIQAAVASATEGTR
ncbi:(2Fe-2S)-binding protein [Roseomonas sp. WA12]